jgi:predicted acylesterase/phospholipase RssA
MNSDNNTIKHIVISSGGPAGHMMYSILRTLNLKGVWDINNIKTIYGSSIGAYIAVILALRYDWQVMDDYLIKRPWKDVFPVKVQNIFEAYTKKGLFDIKTIEKCFKPLFDAKDISLDINLEDFYKLTNIEIHMFTFEINEYKTQDISYKTHPTLSLLTAIQMSCALPVIVAPVCIDGKCFIDGGIGCNYPLNYCIESGKEPDTILGFKNIYCDEKTIINSESSLLDYLLKFIFKAVLNLDNYEIQPIIQNQVMFDVTHLNLDILKNALSSVDARRELFEKGKQSAKKFLDSLQNSV